MTFHVDTIVIASLGEKLEWRMVFEDTGNTLFLEVRLASQVDSLCPSQILTIPCADQGMNKLSPGECSSFAQLRYSYASIIRLSSH